MKIKKRSRASLSRRRGDRSGGRSQIKTNRQGIIIKNETQVEGVRKASQLTKAVLDMVSERIAEGVTTKEIDAWIHDMIIEAGAIPATLGYGESPDRAGFPASACTSINQVVCHGIPSESDVLMSGDIVNVDVTSILDGYFGDASRMFCIGEVDDEALQLVNTAKECMDLGIAEVKPGADFGAIGFAIQSHANAKGYSVVRDFGGHGVGLRFHEEPHVSHFGPARRGIVMREGMIFTIEPMINAGQYGTEVLDDDWTAVTIDGQLSAQWEHTILVTKDGAERLTG